MHRLVNSYISIVTNQRRDESGHSTSEKTNFRRTHQNCRPRDRGFNYGVGVDRQGRYQEGNVDIDLHLTSPFCPAVFGFKIAQDVRDNVYKLNGIEGVKVNVSNHFMAEAINKQVNESNPPAKT